MQKIINFCIEETEREKEKVQNFDFPRLKEQEKVINRYLCLSLDKRKQFSIHKFSQLLMKCKNRTKKKKECKTTEDRKTEIHSLLLAVDETIADTPHSLMIAEMVTENHASCLSGMLNTSKS